MSCLYLYSKNVFYRLIEGENRIGRNSDSHIIVRNSYHGTHHASIFVRQGEAVLYRTSAGLIFVNGCPVHQFVPLENFDYISFADGVFFQLTTDIQTVELAEMK